MTGSVAAGSRDSRVLVFSQRELHRPVWHAWEYEFEDLLLRLDDVSLVAPPRTGLAEPWSGAGRRVLNGAVRRVGGRRTLPPSIYPSMRRTRVESHHDLFFAVIDDPYQLSYLSRLDGWRDRATRTACLLVELWTPDVMAKSDYLDTLSAFDDVYVFNSAVVPRLHASAQDGSPTCRSASTPSGPRRCRPSPRG